LVDTFNVIGGAVKAKIRVGRQIKVVEVPRQSRAQAKREKGLEMSDL